MLGWKAKSNCARVFTAGSLDERMAESRRRLLRSAICAASSSSMASVAVVAPPFGARQDAVHRLQGAGHLQVGEHCPNPVAPAVRRRHHPAASA
ncbi:MAG: hypothetical protein OXG72_00825 [Acidobacteria bacterium]|nr:hypothetical protein [Acidobacteriota bacterium]